MNWRAGTLLAVAVSVLVILSVVEPIPQDPAYFDFADIRSLGGIPNTLDVLSNLGFVVVGAAGLAFVVRHGATVAPNTRLAWLIFFIGITATCFGSGWFHWAPSTPTLIWDRLPMTIGFMSLVAIVISEYFSPSLGRQLLWPLLAIGIVSVAYWAHTEQLGRGDLRPYAAVQFVPMLLIPLVILMYRERSDLSKYLWWTIGFYGLAKVCEHFDHQLFSLGELISGHSLKHLVAALAPAALLIGLRRRLGG